MLPKKGTKKLITEILLVILIVIASGYFGYTFGQSPLKGYKTEVEGLKIEVLDVQNQIGQIKEDYTSLQGDYTELQEDHTIIQEQLRDTNEVLTSTESSFQELETNYDKLKEDYELEKEETGYLMAQLEALNETYKYILKHSAVFVVSELVFNSSEVESGSPIKTSVTVKNMGSLEGTNPIELKIDGVTEATKNVTLSGGEDKTISFDVVKNEVKTYNVTVNGVSGIFKVIRPIWCKIGVPYIAGDGLTVTLLSLTINEKIGSYQYTIWYTLENEQIDRAIDEGTFKMYYESESGGLPQYGFFGELFPGDSLARTYTFEELKDKPFGILAYHPTQWDNPEPFEDSLKWKVEIP